MNPTLLTIIALRSTALALLLAGDQKTSNALYLIADTAEAGKLADDHMREVAEKLKARDLSQADWDDVLARIDADGQRLHGPAE